MGYNTVVLILNDAGEDIRKNAVEFADQVTLGYGAHVPTRKNSDRDPAAIGEAPVDDLSIGSHCNGATVLSCQHSSDTTLLLVGGNYATILGTTYGSEHHKRESVKRMLNDILGDYDLKVISGKKGRR